MKDNYCTISRASPMSFFKEKGSKFYGYAFPIQSEEDVYKALEGLKQEYSSAGHFCYAWKLGTEEVRYRVNDDGEPNNSAGLPIYGQILSYDVTNILVVSVRYFGGTKLGVGGLIQAYKTSAKLTLEKSDIIKKTINYRYQLEFEYPEMNLVMRFVKENQLNIIAQKMDLSCELVFEIRKREAVKIEEQLAVFHKIKYKQLHV